MSEVYIYIKMKTLPNADGEQVRIKNTWLMYIQLLAPWMITGAIWGFALSHTLVGVVVGTVIGGLACLMTAAAMSNSRTAEKRMDVSFAAGAMWVAPAIWLGIIGVILVVVLKVF